MSYEEDLTTISEQVDYQFARLLGQLDKLKKVRSAKMQTSAQQQQHFEGLTDRLQKHFTTQQRQGGLTIEEIDDFIESIQNIKQSLEKRMEETFEATSSYQSHH